MRCAWPSSKPRTKDCAMICDTYNRPWPARQRCCCRITVGLTAVTSRQLRGHCMKFANARERLLKRQAERHRGEAPDECCKEYNFH